MNLKAETPPDNQPGEELHVREEPPDAVNLNVEGRQPQSPREGFGQLWQKTYTVELTGKAITPAEVISVWKERLPDFQPPENRIFTTSVGIEPGEIILINAETPGGPIGTGMLVLKTDEESFTLMTPEGHPESGWITFSAYTESGVTVAQIQSVARASDPLFEIGFRLFGSTMQENIWRYVLTALADHFGVQAEVKMVKILADARLQWSRAGNIRHNAQLHTFAYLLTAPLRKLFGNNDRKARNA